jgi:hypothetical protein
VDKKALWDIRRGIEDLENRHARAVEAGKVEVAAEIAEEIEKAKKYLSSATGLRGKPRVASDLTGRAQ